MPEFVEEANLMSVNLPNTYAGGFVNTTYNPPQEACIVLVLQRSQGTDVTGKLTIYGDWIGGSEFIGAISGTRITFPTWQVSLPCSNCSRIVAPGRIPWEPDPWPPQ